MDQILSQLIPSQRIGQDGFQWWIGQIEGTAADEKNNKGGYRFKVRIVGDHPGDPELIGTEDLPWANVMMPVTVPFIAGNGGGAHPQLEIGCWVVGFYMDTEKQKPIIMGSIGQTPGATKVFTERTPDTPPFVTAVPQLNAQKDGPPIQKGTEKNTATGGLSDGTKDGDDNPRVSTPAAKVAPLKNKTAAAEDWCQSKAEKCDDNDMTSQLTGIMGEFLAAVQNNGGNIGTYVVNQANGVLMDGVNIARGYVNKIMRVVNEFVARVKGFLIEKLTNAVKDLINALLFPSETGNSLTPVTEFFNNLLKKVGCSIADIGERLAEWLTDVLMSYIEQIYKSIACQIDALVNGIISKINSLITGLLDDVLGPLNDILGAIAAPLNIIGGAVNFVLNLLGISCSGPDRSCSKFKQVCTNGGEELEEEGDFLDDLLAGIDNLFPATGADYTQYVCGDAYKGKSLELTTIGFTGGIPKGGGNDGFIPGTPGNPGGDYTGDPPGENKGVSQDKRITYKINNVVVEEGDTAEFVVTRTGYIQSSSSIKYKTLKYRGSATENEDYIPVSDILGFSPGETSKKILVRTINSSKKEQDENFFVLLSKNTPKKGSKIQSKFSTTIASCTITESSKTEPYDPYRGTTKNPEYEFGITFPPDLTFPGGDDDGSGTGGGDDGSGTGTGSGGDGSGTGGGTGGGDDGTGGGDDGTGGGDNGTGTGGGDNGTGGGDNGTGTGGGDNGTGTGGGDSGTGTGGTGTGGTGTGSGNDGTGTGGDRDTNNDGLDDDTGLEIIEIVSVSADRTTCPEGEFIVYTITTTNMENGRILYYTLSGNGITSDDFITGNTTGSFVVNDNKAKVTVGLNDDGVVEDAEVLRFTVNGFAAFVDVVILDNEDDLITDGGENDDTLVTDPFVPPTAGTPITDPGGGIIDIPVDNPGSPWAEPPYVFITGEGIGATATALLDNNGFLTEIRIKSSGFGYKKNLPGDNNKRCIIDSFTVIRPGADYTEPPTIYVNGRTDVAEAIINDDGFLIGARILDRITTYEKYPEIIVVGGNGYGAKLLPSLACLDTDALVEIGSTKIGTGRYVDCP